MVSSSPSLSNGQTCSSVPSCSAMSIARCASPHGACSALCEFGLQLSACSGLCLGVVAGLPRPSTPALSACAAHTVLGASPVVVGSQSRLSSPPSPSHALTCASIDGTQA
eukprot:23851-Prymnesium_polylepis.2